MKSAEQLDERGGVWLTTILLVLLAAVSFHLYRRQEDPWVRKAQLETADRMNSLQQTANTLSGWPPTEGRTFPDVALVDQDNRAFSPSTWRGKPTIVEIATMSCAGCQAFSGGNVFGGFGGFPAQTDLDSIENYFRRYTGFDLFSDKINFAQIIIYNLRLEPARPQDIKAWREHFHFDSRPNTKILTGGSELANGASFMLIPGFYLLDSDGIVVMDATGHTPKRNLYTELFPAAKKLLQRSLLVSEDEDVPGNANVARSLID